MGLSLSSHVAVFAFAAPHLGGGRGGVGEQGGTRGVDRKGKEENAKQLIYWIETFL